MTKRDMTKILKMFKGGISAEICISMIIELMRGKSSGLIAEQIMFFINNKNTK